MWKRWTVPWRLVTSSEQELRALAEEGLMESVDADQLQLTRQSSSSNSDTHELQAELFKETVAVSMWPGGGR